MKKFLFSHSLLAKNKTALDRSKLTLASRLLYMSAEVANRAERVKVKLDSVKMMIRKVQVNSVIQEAHAKTLEMGTAKYPITRGECKTCTVSSGTRSHAEEIPKRIVIGFVRNSGIYGTYQTNPFQFPF